MVLGGSCSTLQTLAREFLYSSCILQEPFCSATPRAKCQAGSPEHPSPLLATLAAKRPAQHRPPSSKPRHPPRRLHVWLCRNPGKGGEGRAGNSPHTRASSLPQPQPQPQPPDLPSTTFPFPALTLTHNVSAHFPFHVGVPGHMCYRISPFAKPLARRSHFSGRCGN